MVALFHLEVAALCSAKHSLGDVTALIYIALMTNFGLVEPVLPRQWACDLDVVRRISGHHDPIAGTFLRADDDDGGEKLETPGPWIES